MSKQLRVSVSVEGPSDEEVQVCDEIPRFVRADPGAVTMQLGAACITFNDREALIAALSRSSSE